MSCFFFFIFFFKQETAYEVRISDWSSDVCSSDPDPPDPVGPATVLFSKTFYDNCRRVMQPGAILVAQNGVPHMQGPELTDAIKLFQKIWAHSGTYLAVVPTYVCGFMAMTWESDEIGRESSRERVCQYV